MHLVDAAARRHGHVGRRRHDDPERGRLRLRAQARAASRASSRASSATARPRKASSTRASTSPRCKAADPVRVREQLLRDPLATSARQGNAATRASGPRHTASRRTVDDGDVLALVRAAPRRRRRDPRAATGPQFLECLTYRWREHVGPERGLRPGYRDADEASRGWTTTRSSASARHARRRERARIDAEVEAEIADAIAFAEASPFPGAERAAHATSPGGLTAVQAHACCDLRRRAREARRRRWGAIRASSCSASASTIPRRSRARRGAWHDEFGPERVFGTPLSEDAMTGVAIGVALAGLRPIHVHIRMDFLMLAMNQLVNIAAKSRYMYGGQVAVPLVVRAMIGKSWGQGAQHSQGLHSLFMHVPGLKVVAPSDAARRQGLPDRGDPRRQSGDLRRASSALLPATARCPRSRTRCLPASARVCTQGGDVTIVGISLHAGRVPARARLSRRRRHPRRSDRPDLARRRSTSTRSWSRSGAPAGCSSSTTRWTNCGASAEIVARVAERLQGTRKPALSGMGFAPTTCPTTPVLEREFYPDPAKIARPPTRWSGRGGPLGSLIRNAEARLSSQVPRAVLKLDDFLTARGPFRATNVL